MGDIYPAFLVMLANKTGLSQRTVEDLLRRGWTYREQTEEVPRWEAPISQLKSVGRR